MSEPLVSREFTWRVDPSLSFEIVRKGDLLGFPERSLTPQFARREETKDVWWAGMLPRGNSHPVTPEGDPDVLVLYAEPSEEWRDKAVARLRRAAGTADYEALDRGRVLYPFRDTTQPLSDFVSMKPTPEGCLDFAKRYGFLGTVGLHTWTLRHENRLLKQSLLASDGVAVYGHAEYVEQWLQLREAFAYAVEMLVSLKCRDTGALSRRIAFTDGSVRFFSASGQEYVKARVTGVDIMSENGITPGDVLSAARYDVMRLGNGLLKLCAPVHPALRWEGEDKIGLGFEPRSLAAVMALQFAVSWVRQSTFSQCTVCGKWISISPPDTRTSRTYCDQACRAKAYRQRQQKARQLYAQGWSVGKLAEEFDATPESVEFWLARTRKNRTLRSLQSDRGHNE